MGIDIEWIVEEKCIYELAHLREANKWKKIEGLWEETVYEGGDRGEAEAEEGVSKELGDLMLLEDIQTHTIAVTENLVIVARKDNSKVLVEINH